MDMSAEAINGRIIKAFREKAGQLVTAYMNDTLDHEEFSKQADRLVDCIETNAPHLVNELALEFEEYARILKGSHK